jgi:hypothetical protein
MQYVTVPALVAYTGMLITVVSIIWGVWGLKGWREINRAAERYAWKRENLIRLMTSSIKEATDRVRIVSHTTGPSEEASADERKEWAEYFKALERKKEKLRIEMLCPEIKDKDRIESLEERRRRGVEIRVTKTIVARPYLRYQICDKNQIVINIQDRDSEESKAGVRLRNTHLIHVMIRDFDHTYKDKGTRDYEDFIREYVLERIPPANCAGVDVEELEKTTGVSYQRLRFILDQLCKRGNVTRLEQNGDQKYVITA